MGFFDSLKSSITTDPLVAEYTLENTHKFIDEDKLWEVTNALNKSSHLPVSIFKLDKRKLVDFSQEKIKLILKLVDDSITFAKSFSNQYFLKICKDLQETKNFYYFITECFANTLFNCLSSQNETNVIYGIHCLISASYILEKSDSLPLLCSTPKNILVNKKNRWKLFPIVLDIGNIELINDLCSDHYPIIFDYGYISYHIIQKQTVDALHGLKFNIASLIMFIFNNSMNPLSCNSSGAYDTAYKNITQIEYSYYRKIPQELKSIIFSYLTKFTLSVSFNQLIQLKYFDNFDLLLIKSVDSYKKMNTNEKANFLENLIKLIPNLKKQIISEEVIPFVYKELVDSDSILTCLKIIIAISKDPSVELKSLSGIQIDYIFQTRDPVILLYVLSNIDFFQAKVESQKFNEYLYQILEKSLFSKNEDFLSQGIQVFNQMVLKNNETMIKKISGFYTIMLEIIIDKHQSLKCQVDALICLSELIKHLAEVTVIDKVLPALMQIETNNDGVLMAFLGVVLGIFNKIGERFPVEIGVYMLIPFLLKIAYSKTLNQSQFKQYKILIDKIHDFCYNKHFKTLREAKVSTVRNSNDVKTISSNKQTNTLITNQMESISSANIQKPLNNMFTDFSTFQPMKQQNYNNIHTFPDLTQNFKKDPFDDLFK